MATPGGTNVVNSIAQRWIMPTLVDQIYNNNLMTYRLIRRNKKILQGGLQIEVPLIYATFTNGGAYQGFDLLDVSPNDTVKNGAWDWKQAFTAVTVDGLTLIRSDSPEAIVNFLSAYFEIAQMDMIDKLGTQMWSSGITAKQIDGLDMAVDDGSHAWTGAASTGTTAATYAGLARASNTFWTSQIDASTTTLTLAKMQTLFGSCTKGARHPTLIVTDQTRYNTLWGLYNLQNSNSNQPLPAQPTGTDEILGQAGFTNLLFNNVPVVVDDHIPGNNTASVGHMFMLNEDYFDLYVNPRADFKMRDFEVSINQDAMTSLILWAGNLICKNVSRQGKFTVLT